MGEMIIMFDNQQVCKVDIVSPVHVAECKPVYRDLSGDWGSIYKVKGNSRNAEK